MIVFGCSVASEERWSKWALPGIQRVSEPDSIVIEERGEGSLQARCNRILERAAAHSSLEAVVLLHEDTEIADDEFAQKIRRRLADSSVGVIGVIGASGVRGIGWWLGKEFHGAVRAPNIAVPVEIDHGTHEVDAVDGLLMVLSPWVVRELRFDEHLDSNFHGYDADICFQARAAGRRVLVDDLDAIHHSHGGIGDAGAWLRADLAFRRKWLGSSRLWPDPRFAARAEARGEQT